MSESNYGHPGNEGPERGPFIMTLLLTGNVRIMIGVFGSACFLCLRPSRFMS